jgi:hypothetical protein
MWGGAWASWSKKIKLEVFSSISIWPIELGIGLYKASHASAPSLLAFPCLLCGFCVRVLLKTKMSISQVGFGGGDLHPQLWFGVVVKTCQVPRCHELRTAVRMSPTAGGPSPKGGGGHAGGRTHGRARAPALRVAGFLKCSFYLVGLAGRLALGGHWCG